MLERRRNIIVEKTELFADRIIRMYQYCIAKTTKQPVELKQVLRSGTSIGANAAEGQYAQTKADFLTKISIALKEANETKYWLGRLFMGGSLNEKEFLSMNNDIEEIISILVKITGTTKERLQK